MQRLTIENIIDHVKSLNLDNKHDDNINDNIINPNLEQNVQNITEFENEINSVFNNAKTVDLPSTKITSYSLLHSILFCLCDKYGQLTDMDKNIYVMNLVDRLAQYSSDNFNNYKDSGCKKQNISQLFKNPEKLCHNYWALKIIADFFCINLIVLDQQKDKVKYIDNFNYYKNILILAYYGSLIKFKPVIFNNKLIHTFNDNYINVDFVDESLIDLLIKYKIEFIDDTNDDKKIIDDTIENNNVNNIQNNENSNEIDNENNDKDITEIVENNIHDNNENDEKQIVDDKIDTKLVKDSEKKGKKKIKKKLDKSVPKSTNKKKVIKIIENEKPIPNKYMKLAELQNIANIYEISLTNGKKKKTRMELYDEIMKLCNI